MQDRRRRPGDDEGPDRVSWAHRVAYTTEGGGYAYRPGQVLIRTADTSALRSIRAVRGLRAADEPVSGFQLHVAATDGPIDVPATVRQLLFEGIRAQPNHVLFADCACGGGCGPHPAAANAWLAAGQYGGNPVYGNPVHSNPVHSNPVHSNPVHSNPVHSNPVHSNPWRPSRYRASGRRASSARPADVVAGMRRPVLRHPGSPVVLVLDTGIAAPQHCPSYLNDVVTTPFTVVPPEYDLPDLDEDGFLDPASGHGSFIAGLIGQVAPESQVILAKVLSNLGDGDENTIAGVLQRYVGQVDLVNLSFSGYTADTMGQLAEAIRRLHSERSPASATENGKIADMEPSSTDGAVVVASAGNDATCRPAFPAALPEVVSVGAIGPDGPAPFTNYGGWVRACAPGVDLISTFFTGYNGHERAPYGERDPDRYDGWATWSGTSFAAPVVAGALAREMQRTGCLPKEAVTRLIDRPGLGRIPGLGTIVNVL